MKYDFNFVTTCDCDLTLTSSVYTHYLCSNPIHPVNKISSSLISNNRVLFAVTYLLFCFYVQFFHSVEVSQPPKKDKGVIVPTTFIPTEMQEKRSRYARAIVGFKAGSASEQWDPSKAQVGVCSYVHFLNDYVPRPYVWNETSQVPLHIEIMEHAAKCTGLMISMTQDEAGSFIDNISYIGLDLEYLFKKHFKEVMKHPREFSMLAAIVGERGTNYEKIAARISAEGKKIQETDIGSAFPKLKWKVPAGGLTKDTLTPTRLLLLAPEAAISMMPAVKKGILKDFIYPYRSSVVASLIPYEENSIYFKAACFANFTLSRAVMPQRVRTKEVYKRAHQFTRADNVC